jgi:tRNA nucleotidyltransferase (CCA-adding enzyme)
MSTGAEPRTTPYTSEQALERLAELPGGPELTELGARRGDLALVGGAVRDLLLGRTPRELDVVVDENALQLAEELAASLQLRGATAINVTAHERFGTAALAWDDGRVDIAERRAETYAAPGALPDVRAGTADEDLARRDFTVNAIAIPLGGRQHGQLLCVEHALPDLAAGHLRVLHDTSFSDDPTRLLRLARYSARLRFQPEPHTLELAQQALADGALGTVSQARIGAELRLALSEADAVGAVGALDQLGVLSAMQPSIHFDAALAGRALELLPDDGRPDLLLLGASLLALAAEEEGAHAMFELLDGLEFPAPDRERAIRTALGAPSVAPALAGVESASEINSVLGAHTLEAVALGAAMSDSATDAVRHWLARSRHVRLEIGGDDLLAAGVPSGPEIGQRLTRVLALKLDGRVGNGRRAELRAALEG